MIKKGLLITLLTIAVILGTISVSVLAETTWPPSTAESDGMLDQAPAAPEIIGDDPDEPGYSGEIVLAGDIPSSGDPGLGADLAISPAVILEGPDVEGWQGVWENPVFEENAADAISGDGTEGEAQPDWNKLLEGEPDYTAPAAESSLDADLDVTYHYLYVAGVAMRPRTDNTSWQYYNQCLIVPSGNEWFVTPINLPDGASIIGLRMFYYDASATTSWSWVTKYDGAGNMDDLGNDPVASVGNLGYGTSYVALPALELVDNLNWSYVLNYRANQTGSTMRLCGLRVYYSMP